MNHNNHFVSATNSCTFVQTQTVSSPLLSSAVLCAGPSSAPMPGLIVTRAAPPQLLVEQSCALFPSKRPSTTALEHGDFRPVSPCVPLSPQHLERERSVSTTPNDIKSSERGIQGRRHISNCLNALPIGTNPMRTASQKAARECPEICDAFVASAVPLTTGNVLKKRRFETQRREMDRGMANGWLRKGAAAAAVAVANRKEDRRYLLENLTASVKDMPHRESAVIDGISSVSRFEASTIHLERASTLSDCACAAKPVNVHDRFVVTKRGATSDKSAGCISSQFSKEEKEAKLPRWRKKRSLQSMLGGDEDIGAEFLEHPHISNELAAPPTSSTTPRQTALFSRKRQRAYYLCNDVTAPQEKAPSLREERLKTKRLKVSTKLRKCAILNDVADSTFKESKDCDVDRGVVTLGYNVEPWQYKCPKSVLLNSNERGNGFLNAYEMPGKRSISTAGSMLLAAIQACETTFSGPSLSKRSEKSCE